MKFVYHQLNIGRYLVVRVTRLQLPAVLVALTTNYHSTYNPIHMYKNFVCFEPIVHLNVLTFSVGARAVIFQSTFKESVCSVHFCKDATKIFLSK